MIVYDNRFLLDNFILTNKFKTSQEMEACLSATYRGNSVCTEDDLNCKCNSVNEVANRCYQKCPSLVSILTLNNSFDIPLTL